MHAVLKQASDKYFKKRYGHEAGYRDWELTPMGKNAPPSTYEITSVEISAFAHATEDEEKVERAIRNIIPEDVGVKIEMKRLRGHYNDPIALITVKITKKKWATKMLRAVIRNLSTLDRYRLMEEIEERVDDAGSLFLRLDKQRAFGGVEVLSEVDSIRVKFRFQIPHGSDRVGFISSAIEAIDNEASEHQLIGKRM